MKKLNFEEISKKEYVREIVRLTGADFATVEHTIRDNIEGFDKIEITVYGAKHELVVENKFLLGLPNLKKEMYSGNVSLVYTSKDYLFKLRFFHTKKCKIVGYEEKVIPATPEKIEKTPIWKCS